MFLNSPFRGIVTVQTHTPGDVIAQLPIGGMGVVQTDELEHELIPAPDISKLDPLTFPTVLPGLLRAHYAPHYADFDLAQGHPHLFAGPPGLTPLDADVRGNKSLLVQYHDRGMVSNNFGQDYHPYTGRYEGLRNPQGYEVVVVLQIEEIIT